MRQFFLISFVTLFTVFCLTSALQAQCDNVFYDPTNSVLEGNPDPGFYATELLNGYVCRLAGTIQFEAYKSEPTLKKGSDNSGVAIQLQSLSPSGWVDRGDVSHSFSATGLYWLGNQANELYNFTIPVTGYIADKKWRLQISYNDSPTNKVAVHQYIENVVYLMQGTPTPTITWTSTKTNTPTITPTPTKTATPTNTSTVTATPTAFDMSQVKLNLQVFNPGGTTATDEYLAGRITNYSTFDIPLNRVSVKAWFDHSGAMQGVGSANNQALYTSAGTWISSVALPKVTAQTISLSACAPNRQANNVGIVNFTDPATAVIKANGGYMETYGSGNVLAQWFGVWPNQTLDQAQDYSQITDAGLGTANRIDSIHYTLYVDGQLVCEWLNPTQRDPNSGQEPCGISPCPPTLTSTNTGTFTMTYTNTPTYSATLTATKTDTSSATNTSTPTFTKTATSTASDTATNSATHTATLTATNTATLTATNTKTSTDTSTETKTATVTPTATATLTPTLTYTKTNSPTATNSPTLTFTPTITFTPTKTLTPTNSPTLIPDCVNKVQIALSNSVTYTNPAVDENSAPELIDGNTNTGILIPSILTGRPSNPPSPIHQVSLPGARIVDQAKLTFEFYNSSVGGGMDLIFNLEYSDGGAWLPAATNIEYTSPNNSRFEPIVDTVNFSPVLATEFRVVFIESDNSNANEDNANGYQELQLFGCMVPPTSTATSTATSTFTVTRTATPTGTPTRTFTVTPTPTAFDISQVKLNLEVFNPGGIPATNEALAARITNWSGFDIPLNRISVKAWFDHAGPMQGISSLNNQALYKPDTTWVVSVAAPSVTVQSVPLMTCAPNRQSNNVGLVQFTDPASSVLAANGGYMETYGSGNVLAQWFADWPDQTLDKAQDYSQITDAAGTGTAGRVNSIHYTLYLDGQLLCEWLSPTQRDPNSGQEPCGISPCPPTATATFSNTVTNTVTVTSTNSPTSTATSTFTITNTSTPTYSPTVTFTSTAVCGDCNTAPAIASNKVVVDGVGNCNLPNVNNDIVTMVVGPGSYRIFAAGGSWSPYGDQHAITNTFHWGTVLSNNPLTLSAESSIGNGSTVGPINAANDAVLYSQGAGAGEVAKQCVIFNAPTTLFFVIRDSNCSDNSGSVTVQVDQICWITPTPTNSSTSTTTNTSTNTITATPTLTPTVTATFTPSATPSFTSTGLATATATPSLTATSTTANTATFTTTATVVCQPTTTCSMTLAVMTNGSGTPLGQFTYPYGMLLLNDGGLLIADSNNRRLIRYDTNLNYTPSNWDTLPSSNYPQQLGMDKSGNVYVPEMNSSDIKVYSGTAQLLRTFGTAGTGNTNFQEPFAVTVDSNGFIYVTDYSLGRVQKFDSNFNLVWVTPTGSFLSPESLVIDEAKGILFVGQTSNGIAVLDPSTGSTLFSFGYIPGGCYPPMVNPWGMSLDSAGNLWLAELPGKVRRYNAASLGKNLTPQEDFETPLNYGNPAGNFDGFGILMDPTGKAYITNENSVSIWYPCNYVAPQVIAQGQAKAALVLTGKTPTVAPTMTATATITATPTTTSTPTVNPDLGLLQNVAACPNLVHGLGQPPVKINFTLASAAQVKLSLMTTLGELVYSKTIEGQAGPNTIAWDLRNKTLSPVASGLYIYYVEAVDANGLSEHKTGKIAILH